ncbi:CocE/NonD family hydrolase [Kordiimonas laminariae]|uniref:CocE/NonD family hydrolase n=1 Tax=Kordiimonas laminariae TaxID=2917717 RepID=UPI001FF5E6D2|nr:CocE/NonD family hydrolase [Kordiimonas laminariae]MCK0068104.1 CocE/NonD family hydrolase [Kordiimonas laminariae]
MKITKALLLTALLSTTSIAQDNFKTPASVKADFEGFAERLNSGSQLHRDMQALAEKLLKSEGHNLDTKMRLLALTGQFDEALKVLAEIRANQDTSAYPANPFLTLQQELFFKTKIREQRTNESFETAFRHVYEAIFRPLNNKEAHKASYYMGYSLEQGIPYMKFVFGRVAGSDELSSKDAASLLYNYQDYYVYNAVIPASKPLQEEDIDRRYITDRNVLIKTPEGITLSAVVVRPRGVAEPMPAALNFTIYNVPDSNLREALNAAAHGYAGVIADARGKRLSTDEIRPYETEHKDANAVVDWISKQSWNNGEVAMYGGSYNGFAAWAAAKHAHPALKTIVPYVAAIPGYGLPMENNISISANYAWPFYVANNRGLDFDLYFDNARWGSLNTKWFESGRPYREYDAVDGLTNPWFQKWLDHPAYDEYWQAMVPYKNDYKNINIPVLSITGYYDDGQISALRYLNDHHTYNKNADHYLVIGPYDHWSAQGTQRKNLRGIELDQSAFINVPEITFEWMDHILKGAPKPALVKNKVNYQVMGADTWKHVPSLAEMNSDTVRYYLNTESSGEHHTLSTHRETKTGNVLQTVNYTDRKTQNNASYPWPIIRDQLETFGGKVFLTDTFAEDMELSGQFSGKLDIRMNKKDVDLAVTLYEILPDGKFIHLASYMGRASYAADETKRHLLTPGEIESIEFNRTRMVSKRIAEGSRIAAIVNVNKNVIAQVNYGTGKDVSLESIKDAGEPLKLEWQNSSYLNLPIKPLK